MRSATENATNQEVVLSTLETSQVRKVDPDHLSFFIWSFLMKTELLMCVKFLLVVALDTILRTQ